MESPIRDEVFASPAASMNADQAVPLRLSQPSMAARWDGARLAPTPPRRPVGNSQPSDVPQEDSAGAAPAHHEDCIVCCEPLDTNRGNPALTWPCQCSLRVHANCAVQWRNVTLAPPCPQCRADWPGASADIALRQFCLQHSIPIAANWEFGPPQPSHVQDHAPPMPEEIVPLCCERLIMVGVPSGS